MDMPEATWTTAPVRHTSPGLTDRPAGRALLATIPSDAHMWNLVFLQLLLEEHGYEVHNLGQCTPVELVVAQALLLRPEIVVISTVNGHGHMDGPHVARALRDRVELSGSRIVIGGKMGVLGPANVSHAGALLLSGFDAVVEADAHSVDPEQLMSLIRVPVTATPAMGL